MIKVRDFHEFLAPVDPLLDFFCRDIASGSLLGRRCWDEEVEATECSDKILSRLEVRLSVVDSGVVIAIATGICDGFISESAKYYKEKIDILSSIHQIKTKISKKTFRNFCFALKTKADESFLTR